MTTWDFAADFVIVGSGGGGMAAALAATALKHAPDPATLLFVIGTEVPPPGGARTDDHGDIPPTTPDSAKATLDAHRDAFTALNLPLDLIGGLVVQPGVEFSPMEVHHLPLTRDPHLLDALTDWPKVCLEAHSTDYQHPDAYPRLAELGFAFQKVGPALTFAWREALYALDTIRAQNGWATGPSLPDTMEAVMLANPGYWQAHIHGDSADPRSDRRSTSCSARIAASCACPAARVSSGTLRRAAISVTSASVSCFEALLRSAAAASRAV